MIKVFHRYPGEGKKVWRTYNVKEEGDLITISYKCEDGQKAEGCFQINRKDYLGTIQNVYIQLCNHGEQNVVFMNALKISPYASMIQVPTDKSTIRLGRFIFEKDYTLIYFTYACENIEGVENIRIPDNQFANALMIEHSPILRNEAHKHHCKKALFHNIDVTDTLAYLEIQVDILTRIILQSGIEIPEELRECLNLADNSSVLDLKPLSKLSEEFDHKQEFRQVQKNYLNSGEQLTRPVKEIETKMNAG